MPNWCNNSVEIYHEDPAMIERVRTAFNEGALLQEFIPVPTELSEATANFTTNEALVAKYGYSSWYDFCVANWGTKWDVGADGQPAQDIEGGLMLSFDSAWSPPTTAYEKLMEQGFTIRAMYCESGMAYAGIWEDGNDDYYEYSGMDSTEIAETLPVELDEAFCISESAAEWEAEDAENIDIDLDGGLSATNE